MISSELDLSPAGGEDNIEFIATKMSKFGSGEISIDNTYWNEGIAIIVIDNAEKRNAISGKMMVDFRNCISKLESWQEGKAVILYGKGNNFCSGGDLDFARNCSTSKDGYYLAALMHDVLRRLEHLPLLSVALVHGPTLGGGAEIAITCDYLLVCNGSNYGFVHGKMGIVTAWGGATRLIKAIGSKKALDMLLTSKVLDADECLQMGLAYKIVNIDNKLQECLDWVRAGTQHDSKVTRSFKQIVLQYDQDNLKTSLNSELKVFVPLWGGKANRDALSKNMKHIRNNK